MKIAGYILSILGLVIIALSNFIAKLSFLSFLGEKKMVYIIVGAIALLAVGIVLVMADSKSSSKIKQASEEVPIYEGEGKKRKIVGYKKEIKK